MTSNISPKPRSRLHSWIAVILNTLVCGVLGVAFGMFGNVLPWLLGGLALGALLGLANEALFTRARCLARWYKLRTVILVLVEAMLVIYLVIPTLGAYHSTHPTRAPITNTPADMGLEYEDVTFPTADGLTLRGWYLPSKNRAAIIAVHGSDGNRLHTIWHAFALAEHGYGVLLFDLRAHGESDGELFPVTNDSPDIAAAVKYLSSRPEIDPERIGAVGLSLGAHVIMQAAPEVPKLKALISDGASINTIRDVLPLPSQFRLLYVAAPMWWMTDLMTELMTGIHAEPFIVLVEKIAPRPILFISSKEEPEPFVNRRLAEHAGPNAQLWELPDTGHVRGIHQHPQEYKQRMLAFFDEALLK